LLISTPVSPTTIETAKSGLIHRRSHQLSRSFIATAAGTHSGTRRKPKFEACRSPKHYTRLKPGKYTFQVRAVDLGSTGPTAKRSFRIA
jgi:hypothetical protein